jgi:2-polyprenyl-3-methyl-5-hydroxy-6-metoxy-1,4-benzoquinol methylase
MKASEKNQIYDNYISTHFGRIHDGRAEFEQLSKYFKKNYLKHLPEDHNAKILDLGCGMGHFLYFLETNGYSNCLGVDISNENIEFCKKRGFNVILSNIFEFLKDSNGSYDTIIMNDLLEHFDKPEVIQLLNMIFNCLDENGQLIIKVPNASNPIMACSSRYLDFTHESLFTEESLSQVLKVSGFEDIRIYPQDLYVLYYNPLNYCAKVLSKILSFTFRLLFIMHGRKTTKIFTKDIIGVATK